MNELFLTDTLEQGGRVPPETVTTQTQEDRDTGWSRAPFSSLFFSSFKRWAFSGSEILIFFFVSLFSICVSPISELPTSPTRKLFQYTELGTESGPQQGLWTWGTCLVSKWAGATDAGGRAVQVQGDQPSRKPLNESRSVWLKSVVH